MDAQPLLLKLLRVMREHRLEAILIGNAGAALHGAPVTTLDFDFMFRDSPANLRKLKAVARSLRAVVLRPYDPVSKLYRLMDDEHGLQVDLMPVIHGVRSFNSLQSRAERRELSGEPLLLASRQDIIRGKKATVCAMPPLFRFSNKRSMKKKQTQVPEPPSSSPLSVRTRNFNCATSFAPASRSRWRNA
jgi:hypothetical protein